MNVNVTSHGELTRPFPGLRPFDYGERQFYCGRTDQIYALYRLVDLSRFVAVVGSSGSGKSSLVFAGLHPLLDEDAEQEGGRHWVWSQMSPKDAPIEGLIDLVHRLACKYQPDLPSDAASLAARRSRIAYLFRLSSQGLVDALAEIEGLKDKVLVLVVDQFEELFRYAKASEPRDPIKDSLHHEDAVVFVQLLLEASRHGTTRIVLTMRSDFIGDCAGFRGLPEAVSRMQFLVPGLTREQFEEVIREPIKRCGATIQSSVVERLLNDVKDEADQLPVLQHCLLRLWEEAGKIQNRATGTEVAAPVVEQPRIREITVAHYNTVGRLARALSQHADEILCGLPGLGPLVERVFRALSEVDKEGRAIRRKLNFAELLAETGAGEADLTKVVDRFRADDCSFLRPSPSEHVLDSSTPVDVGHEALLRRWAKICGDAGATDEKKDERSVGWLRIEDRDARHYQSLVFLAGSGPADPEPLPHSQVKQNLDWWTKPPRTMAWAARYAEPAGYARVQKLIEISRAAFDTAQARRTRIAWTLRGGGAIVCVLLLVTLILGAMFYQQRQQEQTNFGFALQSTADLLDQTLDGLNRGDISTTAAKKIAGELEQNLDKLQQPSEANSFWLRGVLNIPRLVGINMSQEAQSAQIKAVRIHLLLTLSDIFAELGDDQQAFAQADGALNLAKDLAAAEPDNAKWQELIFDSLFRIGDVYVDSGPMKNTKRGLAVYTQAQQIATRLAGEDANKGQWQYDLAFIDNKIGENQNDTATATQWFNAALALAPKIAAMPTAKVEWKTLPAVTLTKIGKALVGDRQFDKAINNYDDAIGQLQGLLKDSSVNNDAVSSNLANAYRLEGDALAAEAKTDASKYPLAFANFDAAIGIAKSLVDKDPDNADWLVVLAVYYREYGNALEQHGAKQAALNEYTSELGIRQRLWNKDKTNPSWQKSLASTQKTVDALNAELAKSETHAGVAPPAKP